MWSFLNNQYGSKSSSFDLCDYDDEGKWGGGGGLVGSWHWVKSNAPLPFCPGFPECRVPRCDDVSPCLFRPHLHS